MSLKGGRAGNILISLYKYVYVEDLGFLFLFILLSIQLKAITRDMYMTYSTKTIEIQFRKLNAISLTHGIRYLQKAKSNETRNTIHKRRLHIGIVL